jgi:tryptophan synthase beta chain
LQDDDGQMQETHSIAAGLDYVGVSPILANFKETGRARFEAATDDEVVEAVALTMRKEGLIPALESAHAFAQAFKEAPGMSGDDSADYQPVRAGRQGYLYHCRRLRRPGLAGIHHKKAEQYR